MFRGIDPQKLARTQEVTRNITGIMTIRGNTVLLELKSDDDAAKQAIPALLSSFAESLAEQLSTFFAIRGKIVKQK